MAQQCARHMQQACCRYVLFPDTRAKFLIDMASAAVHVASRDTTYSQLVKSEPKQQRLTRELCAGCRLSWPNHTLSLRAQPSAPSLHLCHTKWLQQSRSWPRSSHQTLLLKTCLSFKMQDC